MNFIVEGSVAVNVFGERLGKGEGYGEIEFAILLELGAIHRDVPIATTVHELQFLKKWLPQEPYDITLSLLRGLLVVLREVIDPLVFCGIY